MTGIEGGGHGLLYACRMGSVGVKSTGGEFSVLLTWYYFHTLVHCGGK